MLQNILGYLVLACLVIQPLPVRVPLFITLTLPRLYFTPDVHLIIFYTNRRTLIKM